jgi:hypothetical protein
MAKVVVVVVVVAAAEAEVDAVKAMHAKPARQRRKV